ncbi:iron chaperone [Pelagerythrobacter aerophilus]
MRTDPHIDAYIDKAEDFAQPILRHVRALVHSALPEAEEAIKWGMPHFMVGGKNVVGMAAFKAHAAVMIHGEDDSAEGMGTLGKIASLEELPPDEDLAARFRAAADAFISGKASKRAAKPKPRFRSRRISLGPSTRRHGRVRSSIRSRPPIAASIWNGSSRPSARRPARSASPPQSSGWPRARSATGSTRAASRPAQRTIAL